MRSSTIYLGATAGGCLLLVLMALHATMAQSAATAGQAARSRLVRELQLTDLCLVTEARYTRHPTMADTHAPFQDHPLSLEHFPSGALILPPADLVRHHAPAP